MSEWRTNKKTGQRFQVNPNMLRNYRGEEVTSLSHQDPEATGAAHWKDEGSRFTLYSSTGQEMEIVDIKDTSAFRDRKTYTIEVYNTVDRKWTQLGTVHNWLAARKVARDYAKNSYAGSTVPKTKRPTSGKGFYGL